MEGGFEESKVWGERQVRRISVMHVKDREDLMKMVAAGMNIVTKF